MKFLKILLLALLLVVSSVEAKGGFSSGGGRGGFSSGGSRSTSSFSRPSYSTPARSTTVVRNTTIVNRTSVGSSYGGRYVNYGHPYMYGGMGMGYGYSNGLLTGMIIANMMHPQGTVMYTGGGMYANNALLYPDGRVVNQQGYLVGNYINNQFVPVQNGGMVAQPVPQDAIQQAPQQQVAQPVVIQQDNTIDIVLYTLIIIMLFFILLAVIL